MPSDPRPPVGPDPDQDQFDALKEVGKRALIFLVPLLIIGALVTALGVPWWITGIALIVAEAILVFELEI